MHIMSSTLSLFATITATNSQGARRLTKPTLSTACLRWQKFSEFRNSMGVGRLIVTSPNAHGVQC